MKNSEISETSKEKESVSKDKSVLVEDCDLSNEFPNKVHKVANIPQENHIVSLDGENSCLGLKTKVAFVSSGGEIINFQSQRNIVQLALAMVKNHLFQLKTSLLLLPKERRVHLKPLLINQKVDNKNKILKLENKFQNKLFQSLVSFVGRVIILQLNAFIILPT